MCVSPVLCLLNVLPAQFAVWGLQQVLLLLRNFAIFYCTTASAVCCVCKSCVVFALPPAQCAVCCNCTTANTVCCVCKSYVVFALLPAQCAVCVSPMLCLHYCRHSVLCVVCCVCITASAVCCLCESCTTASAVCCVWKSRSCAVFALLPVQCAVSVSPVLCLLNVLYTSAVCRAGATINPLIIILFRNFFIVFTHSH